MKRKITLVILVLFFLIFTSCISSSESDINVVKYTPLQTYPSWWTEKNKSTSKKLYFYAASKRMSSPYLAKINAYETVLEDISLFLGVDVKERYMAEFISVSKIAELSAVIEDIIVYEHSPSSYECLVKVSCPTDILFINGVISKEEFESKRQRISLLRKQASDAYRDNRDYDALSLYIEACLIAETNTLFDGKDSFEDLSAKAERIVKNSYLSIQSGPSSAEGQTFVMRRRFGIIHPVIKGAVVEASLTSVQNSLNPIYTTDEKGRFVYLTSLQSDKTEGSVEFGLLLPSTISHFKTKRGEAFVKALKNAASKNKIALSYNNERRITEDNISLLMMFYDKNGLIVQYKDLNSSFIEKIEESGKIKVDEDTKYGIQSDDQSEKTAESIALNNSFDSRFVIVVIGKVDEVSAIPVSSEKAVHIELNAAMADTSAKKILYSSSSIDGSGYDQSEDEATKKAFGMALDYLYSVLDDVLYN